VLMPSQEKPHYVFTQHDVAKIFHTLFVSSDLCSTLQHTGQYWMFLCKNTFMARLMTADDCSMCNRIMLDSLDTLSEHINTSTLLGRQTFVCVQNGTGVPATVHLVNNNNNTNNNNNNNNNPNVINVGANSGNNNNMSAVDSDAPELCDVLLRHIDMTSAAVASSHTLGSNYDITACAAMYADVISSISVALNRAGMYACMLTFMSLYGIHACMHTN
jgi:hypothetical protein